MEFDFCYLTEIILRFRKLGWKGLREEIEMELQRISSRNLGRDDRYSLHVQLAASLNEDTS